MEKKQQAALLTVAAKHHTTDLPLPSLSGANYLTASNADFIAAIFSNLPEGAFAAVCTKRTDPTNGGWSAMQADAVNTQCPATNNNYFNCSSFHQDTDGTIKARKDQFSAFHCLVLDDVGTKVSRERLGDFKPSWEIETSPGNYQIGIILTQPLTDSVEVTQLQNAIIVADLCDPGATGLARWARLPVGINGKPKYANTTGAAFNCRLTCWNQDTRYTSHEIVTGLKLTMAPVAPSGSQVRATVNALPYSAQTDLLVASGQLESEVGGTSLAVIAALLNCINPGCDYGQWSRVLMAVSHETGGSDDGLTLVDAWSSKGANYKGIKDIEVHWRSFRSNIANPLTVGTLIKMAHDAGADTAAIMLQDSDEFEICDYAVVPPATTNVTPIKPPVVSNPLAQFSLIDQVDRLEKQMVAEKLILGQLVLLGQATVIYAAANTGKTLITLSLIIQGIKHGLIDPSKLYYINMDDNSSGIVAKGRLAAEYKFNMLADGHLGFEAKVFRSAMQDMIEKNTASGVIIVLDTLKKFVNTMDKGQSSNFAKVIRQFVLKGGTVIALSHTNKNPGQDGRPVYSGTTDIVDDFDCAYTLETVSQQADTNQKFVEFTNIKRRGNVALTAGYSYAFERDIHYNELLLSVQEADHAQLLPIKHAVEVQSDANVINAVIVCIKAGVNSKMKLATATAERAQVSQRAALKVIEKYTGVDPAVHQWSFEIRERGAMVFVLPERPPAASSAAAMITP